MTQREPGLVYDATHPAPDEMPAAEASRFMIPFHTAWIGLVTRAKLEPGETLVVLGASGGTVR